MDKTRLVITESFSSVTEEERKANLQKAVDQYIILNLKKGKTQTKGVRQS